MKSFDFEYDGINLSDLGYMICDFNSSDGLTTVSNGSQITFNTTPVMNGSKHEHLSSQYDDCLEATIQICKDVCSYGDLYEIPFKELRDLMSWLNRKEYHKFKLLEDDYLDLFFQASFNISKIEMGGKVYGLELALKTNRPFALKEPQTIIIENLVQNGTKTIYDTSDEEGYIYPHMKITIGEIGEGGTLSIYNALEDRTMNIKNCTAGEVITLDYPIIETSIPSHEIEKDFDWNFFRIANTFKNKQNELTISLPCTIQIKYSPIVKMGI